MDDYAFVKMLKIYSCVINFALFLARFDAYFHINDDAKKCKYLSATNNFIFSHNSF